MVDCFIPLWRLQKALKAMSVIVKANAKDSSAHIVIDTSATGRVVFAAYNGQQAITHYIDDCEVTSEGRVCIIFTKLDKFLGAFIPVEDGVGVENVCIKELKTNIAVSLVNIYDNGKQSKNRITLAKQPTHHVYIAPPFGAPTFSINGIILSAALAKVAYAVDVKSNRPFIQGMNIKFTEDFIYFVGTDGLKLSEYRVNNTGEAKDTSYIVPYTFLAALRKIMDVDEQVFFEITEGKVRAVAGTTTLHGNLILGEPYPDYDHLFDKYTHKLTIDKQILMSTFIPYLSILNKDDHKRISIHIKDKTLLTKSDNSEAVYENQVDFDGDFVIDVNGEFLAKALETTKDDTIDMMFSDAQGNLMFNSANFHDQRTLLTPIKRRA